MSNMFALHLEYILAQLYKAKWHSKIALCRKMCDFHNDYYTKHFKNLYIILIIQFSVDQTIKH